MRGAYAVSIRSIHMYHIPRDCTRYAAQGSAGTVREELCTVQYSTAYSDGQYPRTEAGCCHWRTATGHKGSRSTAPLRPEALYWTYYYCTAQHHGFPSVGRRTCVVAAKHPSTAIKGGAFCPGLVPEPAARDNAHGTALPLSLCLYSVLATAHHQHCRGRRGPEAGKGKGSAVASPPGWDLIPFCLQFAPPGRQLCSIFFFSSCFLLSLFPCQPRDTRSIHRTAVVGVVVVVVVLQEGAGGGYWKKRSVVVGGRELTWCWCWSW